MTMEINRQRNSQDDCMSDCWGFGSSRSCSQSRKISIGVMVDSVKTRPKTMNQDEAAVPTAEKVSSSRGNSMEDRNNGEGVIAAIKGKQTEAPEQDISPRISMRSFHQKTPNSEADYYVKQTSNLPAASVMHNRFNGLKAAPTEYSVEFFANHMSILQSGDGNQKKFNRFIYGKKGGKDVTTESVEKFSFATAQEVLVPEKEVEDKTNTTENKRSEELRMRLWDILGTVSSPNKQFSNSQAPEVGAKKNQDQELYQKGNPVVKPRQNSDTIETDSESPDNTTRRPMTRSLTRKRVPTKMRLSKIKNVPSFSYNKQKHLEENIFSFEEGWSRRLRGAVNGTSSMSTRNKSEGKSFRTKIHRIYFPEKDNIDDTQHATDKSKKTLPTYKTSSLTSKIGVFHGCPPKNNSVFVEPENDIGKKDSHGAPVIKMTNQLGDMNSPALPEHADQKENFANSSLKDIVDPGHGLQSQTFGTRTPIKSSSPGCLLKTNQKELDDHRHRTKTTLPAKKASSLGNKIGGFHGCPSKNNSEFVDLENEIQKKDLHGAPVMKMTNQLDAINSPALPEHEDQQENFVNSSLKAVVDPKYGLQSRTFGMRTPVKSYSPDCLPKTDQRELDDHIPAGRVFKMKDILSFKTLLTSTIDFYKTSLETHSSDDAGELEDSPAMESVPIMEEKDAENRLSISSSEEMDSESSEEDSPMNGGHREMESLSPEIGSVEKPKFVLRPSKRLRSQEGIEVNGFSPTVSPKEIEESNRFQGHLEQNQEDGLTSAVALFSLALERVKNKMKSVTSKKSAEILISVAEGIHSQLQNAESQIQTDVGKLTGLSKSKRKRLETRFQEQQEQLKLIHEKFKEEVNQHIRDCRSTLEGLEAHRVEFKGAGEKQKASHRKLLLQAEEAIGAQLSDAQQRITAVHKLARKKMVELKYVIAECLREGILS
ncbi:hypothetical protein F0562_021523 [Nyssa sinensis]|uniref:Meiosis-specific protein ASY3-like coiled-coil domain-containing protein n=1 Tax=Nyssa sinensis TaxID=561372 RepID=A0A5J5BMM8_9ASTE|nr:hypothetical protein F0562_021523 [Nyssa sinensis]